MTDDFITVPDYVPMDLQLEYLDTARERVLDLRDQPEHLDAAPERVLDLRDQPADQPADEAAPILLSHHPPAETDRQVALATMVAFLLGFVGIAALTGLWGWLAATHDPMWWGFAGLGAALLVVLCCVAAGFGVHTIATRRRLRSARVAARS